MAKKKVAAKKAAKKKVAKAVIEPAKEVTTGLSTLIPDYGFDVLSDDEDVSESIEEVLQSVASRRKNYTVQFNKMSEVRSKMLPLKHFYLQWLFGMYGIPESSLLEIIGAEGVGKTTLAFQLMGNAMDVGCPAYYIECENKQMMPGRILRALHSDKSRAMKMLERLRKSQVFSLDELENELDTIVQTVRGERTLKGAKHVPIHVPIVIAIDPWSKLMNLDEAAGRADYGDNQSEKKKGKRIASGTGRTMGHAMWAQSFCRKLPYFLSKYNVILIMVHHQNDEVDMSGGMGGLTMSKEVATMFNKTKVGGRAFNQNAAFQLILGKGAMSKNGSGDVKGRCIKARVDKNSFGPADRKLQYEIRTDHYEDTDTYLEPSISFDEDWAKWMASNKFFGTTVNKKRYTCDSLGVEGATFQQFAAAFNANEALKHELGERLGIEGYFQTVDRIMDDVVAEKVRKEEEAKILAEAKEKADAAAKLKEEKTIDIEVVVVHDEKSGRGSSDPISSESSGSNKQPA